ncbi:MAG: hypothetical protein J6R13_07570 [Alistipes sp.]|nr:hypothetical protein [Alistipes sp.]
MVNEVNKIISNMLLSDREVRIGSLGTLFTVRYAAYRASRKSLTPPYRIVQFTNELRGTSLEDEIATVANIGSEKAHEVFEQWMTEVQDDNTLKIEGVGTLRGEKFSIDDKLASELNPHGRAPMRLKPKANVGLYIFAAICILFAITVAGYVYIDNNDINIFNFKGEVAQVTDTAEIDTAEPAATEDVAVVAVADTVVIDTPTAEPTVVPAAVPTEVPAPQPKTTTTSASNEVLSTTSGTSYVVLGVFSTPENAKRAISQAQKKANDLQYAIYHYGEKFMVALYDAPSRTECQEFARTLSDTFKDLWIYSRK